MADRTEVEKILYNLQQLDQQAIQDKTMYQYEVDFHNKKVEYLKSYLKYLNYVRSKIHFDRM